MLKWSEMGRLPERFFYDIKKREFMSRFFIIFLYHIYKGFEYENMTHDLVSIFLFL